MKKRHLFSLLALVLCLATLLSACKKNVSEEPEDTEVAPTMSSTAYQMDSLLNPNYTQKTSHLSAMAALPLTGKLLCANDGLLVTQSGEDSTKKIEIFSYYTGAVIRTYTNSVTANASGGTTVLQHGVFLYDTTFDSVFAVLSATYDPADTDTFYAERFDLTLPKSGSFVIDLFDATGALLKAIPDADVKKWIAEDRFNDGFSATAFGAGNTDLFYVGSTVFRASADGLLATISTYDLITPPTVNYSDANYYYRITDDRVSVYTKQLSRIASYVFPGYLEKTAHKVAFPMNNGNVYIQYTVLLPSDAKTYDLYREGQKYELCSRILSVKDGSCAEIDANYLMSSLTPANATKKMDELFFTSPFAASVENVATIHYLTDDGFCDMNDPSFVNLSADGAIVTSLKFLDRMTVIPSHTSGGLYLSVNDLGEVVYLNREGKTVGSYHPAALRENGGSFGAYLYTASAIYTVTGELVYNLQNNHATVLPMVHSALILSGKDSTQTLSLFDNGEMRSIGTVGGSAPTLDYYAVKDDLFVLHSIGGKYSYYSTSGTLLGESEHLLRDCAETIKGYLYTDDVTGTFYHFTFSSH